MKLNIWEKFKWVFITALKFKRTPYPLTVWGARLILASLGFASFFAQGIFTIKFTSNSWVENFQYIAQEPTLWSGICSVIAALTGLLLIYKDWDHKARHSAKVLISALPNTSIEFPESILDIADKPYFREAIILGKNDGNAEDFEAQISRYNAEREVDIFNRFILHDNCQKLYIGGLARVPMLVAYGAFLRTTHVEIKFFDKIHKDGNWSLLDDENLKIGIKETQKEQGSNSSGDIGLAVGFTFPVHTHQLPENMRENTRILTVADASTGFNLIKNQESLNEIIEGIAFQISELSQMERVKRIHLFLSVQSAVALALGKRYQEGIGKNWVIHNFEGSEDKYTWAVELSKSGIKKH